MTLFFGNSAKTLFLYMLYWRAEFHKFSLLRGQHPRGCRICPPSTLCGWGQLGSAILGLRNMRAKCLTFNRLLQLHVDLILFGEDSI